MRNIRSYLVLTVSAIGTLVTVGALALAALTQILSATSFIKDVQEAPGDLGIALRFFFSLNIWVVLLLAVSMLAIQFWLVFEQSDTLAKAKNGLLEIKNCREILESAVAQQENLAKLGDGLKANSDADFILKGNQIGTSLGVLRGILAFELAVNPARILAMGLKADRNSPPLIGWAGWSNLYARWVEGIADYERVASSILGGLDRSIPESPNRSGILTIQMKDWDIPANIRHDYIMFEKSLHRLRDIEAAISAWSNALWPQNFSDWLTNPNKQVPK